MQTKSNGQTGRKEVNHPTTTRPRTRGERERAHAQSCTPFCFLASTPLASRLSPVPAVSMSVCPCPHIGPSPPNPLISLCARVRRRVPRKADVHGLWQASYVRGPSFSSLTMKRVILARHCGKHSSTGRHGRRCCAEMQRIDSAFIPSTALSHALSHALITTTCGYVIDDFSAYSPSSKIPRRPGWKTFERGRSR